VPKISAVTTAVPEYRIDQQTAQEFARSFFSANTPDIDRLLPLFGNTGVDTRYFSAPPDWFGKPHTLAEKNSLYVEAATSLAATAIRLLLDETDLRPEQIDYVIYVNTTGLATPSIDARLINLLGFRPDIRRTPVWGLGCAGGAAGLAHAYHHALGHPDQRTLVVAAELCGLTFMADDLSRSNLVATALFGEGAAAALITGDDIETAGLDIQGTKSRFYPDSLDVMGWSVVSSGLQVVFAQRIPAIVEANVAEDFGDFLAEHDMVLQDIDQFLIHPGGSKVIEAYKSALNLDNGQLNLAREVLRDFGNMSSVTVLFVLERYIRRYGFDRGGRGLISALGPGFCSESLLVNL